MRSRINPARGELAQVLLATAAQAHVDASARAEDGMQQAAATLQGGAQGHLPGEVAELWPRRTELLGPPGERVHPFPAMRRDWEAGVCQHLPHVVAGRDITVWELDVIDPADAVSPWPATLARITVRRDRKLRTLRVLFPGPPR
ncbi:hypothetical protein [Streptomyces sp. NPDC002265]|uniref:hypothetical protein n=1 Tax=Streptomyces sp. NPDC002265 TaxID=3154415 RepID=UPI00332F030A